MAYCESLKAGLCVFATAATLMAFRLSDEILPAKYGYPFKIRIPTKLGFKNPKFVTAIYVTDKQPRGYWTDRRYNWFSGI